LGIELSPEPGVKPSRPKKKKQNGDSLGFEANMFLAADKLRKNLEPSDYKHVCLGLIFLKHTSIAFEAKRAALLKEDPAAAEDPDEYLAENVFWVPKVARWSHLQANAKQPNIGKLIDDAMAAIEKANDNLKGVLPKDYNRPALDKIMLGELIDLISGIATGEPGDKAISIDNDLRGTLRNFGLKVGMAGAVKFEARIRELVEDLPDMAFLIEPLLIVRRVLREELAILHRRLLTVVRGDEVCRRLMSIHGVGPVVALTYRAAVDVPARFKNSKAVGAAFGLMPSKYQSGEINRSGAISKCGDEMVRTMLYEAAHIMLVRSTRWSWLRAWAMKIAKTPGRKKAVVALARCDYAPHVG